MNGTKLRATYPSKRMLTAKEWLEKIRRDKSKKKGQKELEEYN